MSNKKRYLVIGDTHGSRIWKDIIEKENPGMTIFLGDYVSSHNPEVDSDQQIEELYAILDYKDQHKDSVILLRGNHDLAALGYSWAECSGYDARVYRYVQTKDVSQWFLGNTQWVYIIPNTNIVCSHAGISKQFLENAVKYYHGKDDNIAEMVEEINTIEPCELFAFTPCKLSDYTGISATQPCTWIRPVALVDNMIPHFTQVVGHTPIRSKVPVNINQIDDTIGSELLPDLWLCDCLESGGYLVIEDGKFKPKNLNA